MVELREGAKIGSVTLICKTTIKNREVWYFECECGKIWHKQTLNILINLKKDTVPLSCGCRAKDFWQTRINPNGYKDICQLVWSSLKTRAKNKKFDLDITLVYIWELYIAQNRLCALSGVPIEFNPNPKYQLLTTASIDRIDSDKGYVKGNIQIVHKEYNALKNKYSMLLLKYVCKKIVQNKGLTCNKNLSTKKV